MMLDGRVCQAHSRSTPWVHSWPSPPVTPSGLAHLAKSVTLYASNMGMAEEVARASRGARLIYMWGTVWYRPDDVSTGVPE